MRYEEYKPIDAKWEASIPSHWDYVPLRHIFIERKEINVTSSCTDILSLTNTHGVIPYSQKGNMGNKQKDDLSSYHIAHVGDLVVNSMNVIIGSSGVSKYHGCVSPVYYTLTIRNDDNVDYYGYFFKIPPFFQSLKPLGNGILEIRLRIPMNKLNTVMLPVPPREEQDQIVRYLDWKVSCINKLIHGYQRQIKLLEERRQTVIDRATLESIDGAKLKDSGTHWVKRIPENWEMVYSKKLFSERKDKAFPNDEQLTASQKYGVISQKEFIEREGRRVTVVLTGSDILKHVGIGDFIISMRSFQGGLEYSYVEGKISSAYVMLIPRKEFVYDEYFKWLLKSKPYIKALQGTSDLVRDGQALRYANFAKVPLPQIPLDEQKRIAEHIEIETSKIDAAIPVFEKQIELLKEYRTRLISDVVTGQMDVRGVVVPDYTPEDDAVENEADEEMTDEEVSMDAD